MTKRDTIRAPRIEHKLDLNLDSYLQFLHEETTKD